MDKIEPNELPLIKCRCRRFLGKGKVVDGEVYIYCPNCKAYAAVLGKKQERSLTTEKMMARIVGDAPNR